MVVWFWFDLAANLLTNPSRGRGGTISKPSHQKASFTDGGFDDLSVGEAGSEGGKSKLNRGVVRFTFSGCQTCDLFGEEKLGRLLLDEVVETFQHAHHARVLDVLRAGHVVAELAAGEVGQQIKP